MNNALRKITVLVNSTDLYADAWDPFFRLLEMFWPEWRPKVVLNSESKVPTWVPPGTVVHHNGRTVGKSHWPSCLKSALGVIETPYVLYLQEDYFLNRRVNETALEQMVRILDDGAADAIRCRELGGHGKYAATRFQGWIEVPRSHGYYASLQAGLWRKQALAGLLVDEETAWEFEKHGTRRARRNLKAVYSPDPSFYPGNDSGAFSYEPTGIRNGRWYRPAVERLFAEHKIKVSFEERGFYEPTRWQQLVQRQRNRIRKVVMRF
jgi:hypothetical protein